MYRVTLTDEQHHELNRRAHQLNIAPSTRDRLEMVRLSDAGCSVPQIACHLGQHEQTVRCWIKAFLSGGFEALANQPRGESTSWRLHFSAESCHARGRAASRGQRPA